MAAVKRPSSQAQHRDQIARARRFLDGHLAEPLGLGRIARAAGAAPHHFARLFHALTGETIFAYVTRARLRTAARQLLGVDGGPPRPVGDIALDVGYATASAFSRAFRATVGMTPRAFRGARSLSFCSFCA